MFVVDTNVLVYAADDSAPEQDICRRLIEGWRRDTTPFYLTWAIVYEFLRVVTHPRVLRRPQSAEKAWSLIDAVLVSPSGSVLVAGAQHQTALAALIAESGPVLAGNLLHDAHTAVLMREHGVRRIVTRDTDFHRFPFLEVQDPLTEDPS